MSATHSTDPLMERGRRTDAWWTPHFGPGMVLGLLGTIGLVVSMFLAWRTVDIHPSDVPLAFLFDSGTTAQDPSLLLALVPLAVLLGIGSVMPQASAARFVGALGSLVVVILFAVALNNQLDALPGSSIGDVLDTGYYVAAIAAVAGLVSGFMPAGWTRTVRTESYVDGDGIDLNRPRV